MIFLLLFLLLKVVIILKLYTYLLKINLTTKNKCIVFFKKGFKQDENLVLKKHIVFVILKRLIENKLL